MLLDSPCVKIQLELRCHVLDVSFIGELPTEEETNEVYQLPLAGPKSDKDNKRREMLHCIQRRPDFEGFIEEAHGYAWIPADTLAELPAAIEFSQQIYRERSLDADPDPRSFRSADLLAGAKYEDAKAFFDLALSNEIIQLASDYLGEIPVLASPRLWWTKPVAPGTELGDTQMFHVGNSLTPAVHRQSKFLFTMNDVDAESGPFTFLPADISANIARTIQYEQGKGVRDEEIYLYARATDTMTLVGSPGTGLFVDTSRCFHFGRRGSSKERLLLMIQFKKPTDMPKSDRVTRTASFIERYGADPIRMLILPEW